MLEKEIVKLLISTASMGTVLLIFLYGVWRIISYLGIRLFDDETGVLPQYIRDNRDHNNKIQDFLERLGERNERQLSMCDQHGSGIATLNEYAKANHDVLREIRDISARSLETSHAMSVWHEDPTMPTNATKANQSLADLARAELLKLKSCKSLSEADVVRIEEILNRIVERSDFSEAKT